MRASRQVRSQKSEVRSKESKEIHISGAEGLYEFPEVDKVARDYFLRAISHPKGKPDKIVISIEKVGRKPLLAPLLPVSTVRCDSTENAVKRVKELLSGMGISDGALRNGIKVVTGRSAMHGAALILSESGGRVEPDKERGIRVSRLGIGRHAEKSLSGKLVRRGINTTTVKEAIILASKVASCRGVIAELCISDDPDYTTGYVASKMFGYVRIPHIKEKGSLSGGRVFFIEEDADVKRVIEYLEKTLVLMGT
jgi:6-carboxyhexanoate--CoA ligase